MNITDYLLGILVGISIGIGAGIGISSLHAMDTDQTRSRECSPLNSTTCDRHPPPPPNPCGDK